jgi:hypothetical protein
MTLASEAGAGLRHADRFFIGGQWVAPASTARIEVIDCAPGTCGPSAPKDYVAHRIAEGRTRKEILRCLKRYIARETSSLLTR